MIVIKISAIKFRNIIACLRVDGRDYTIDRQYVGGSGQSAEAGFVAKWATNARTLKLALVDERHNKPAPRFRISVEPSEDVQGQIYASVRAVDLADHPATVAAMHLGLFYAAKGTDAIDKAKAVMVAQGLIKSDDEVEVAIH